MPAPTMPPASDLRLTLAGVARLAGVKRPVVSMWRTRLAASDAPFPASVSNDRGVELFDAVEVANWLVETQHGNNPSAIADAPAHAMLGEAGHDGAAFRALTALVALRAAHGEPIGGLDHDDLVDLADEYDPDDECLFREVEELATEGPAFARFVDALVDGAFGAAPAFESVMSDRFRAGRREHARVALGPEASALVSEVAIELALTNPDADAAAPCFVDPTGVSGDRLVDIAERLTDLADATVMSADADADAARLLRRRLLAHGIVRTALAVEASGDFTVTGPVVHVAQYPTPAQPALGAPEILDAIEQIVLQMDDAQRGVVIAPASVLIDGGLAPDVSAVRSALLRSGRVRAIIRFPAGLLAAQPRQVLALWVLGPAHERVALADRWTMLGDLIDRDLAPTVRADLVGDLAASMGDRTAVHAHPFSFARLVPTSALLALRGSLLEHRAAVRHAPIVESSTDAATIPARIDELLASMKDPPPVAASIRPAAMPEYLPPARLGRLAADRHVRCLPGARIGAADIGSDTGFTVIGPDEVAGGTVVGSRAIDRLLLASHYPNATLTEPGDVVFTTSPRPHAWVDRDGASVVAFPARVLRVNSADAAGLMPDVLAADIESQPARSRDWHEWSARRVLGPQRAGLEQVLTDLRESRAAACRHLDDLARLQSLITAGITSGVLQAPTPLVE